MVHDNNLAFDPAQRYLSGQLRQTTLPAGFEPSRPASVPHVDQLPSAQRTALIERGRQLVQSGQVAFSILAAGAASRMSASDLPTEVRRLMEHLGWIHLPSGKALVPVIEHAGVVWTYLDLFVENAHRFLEQLQASAPVVLFVSPANHQECVEYLATRWAALRIPIVYLEQPLARAFVATELDVQKARHHFPAEEFDSVLAYARHHAGQYLPYEKPAGHGEFLHQLIASGLAGTLANQGIRYISVRNIDNVAALLDQRWLAALGYLDQEKADMLAEVSQRPAGQKGGALIRRQGRWLLAEDPSFVGTGYSALDSYYINNAVAIFDLSLLWKLYDTTPEDLSALQHLPADQYQRELQKIADRGRQRFPTLIDPKPFRLPDGQLTAAVVPETNMWESTLIDERIRLLPWAVDSDQDAGSDLLLRPVGEQEQRVLRVRFCPVKTWIDYQEPRKQLITRRLARRILEESLI